jgi:hypothetical protein
MSENLLLVHEAAGKMNGANVHRGTAVLRAYQNALDVLNDSRCRNRAAARRAVWAAELELRKFTEGGR